MDDKFNRNYVCKINDYIRKIDDNKIKLEKEVEKLNSQLFVKLENYNELIKNKRVLEQKYEQFLNFIINKGMSFEVNNSYHDLKQWDSIQITFEKNRVIFGDKKGQVIKIIEDLQFIIIKDMLDMGYIGTAIVLRIQEKIALIQLRFNKI
ncbi:hypothetical protein [Clostridium sp. UBA4548]|uniref:hypothetical protein n=1 Tax=Clostridium sp. UBA4548 TaxID=1946361 RepID=UPI0025C26627|nr:hypothetical protein [Clostridium sp. UBA4548]